MSEVMEIHSKKDQHHQEVMYEKVDFSIDAFSNITSLRAR